MKYTFTSTSLELIDKTAEEVKNVPDTAETHVVKDTYDVVKAIPDGEGGHTTVEEYSHTGYFTKEESVAKQAKYASAEQKAEAGSDERASHKSRKDIWQLRIDEFNA